MNRVPRMRWLRLRVALFFLAAVVWMAGVVIDVAWIRWAAMGFAFVALVLGLIARRTESSDPASEHGG